MYISELKGKHVISLAEALKMGVVQDALLDPTGRYVAALRVRGINGQNRVVRRQYVKHVGLHAVVLAVSDDLTDSDDDADLDRLIDLRTLIGLEVISDQGNLLGHVRDALIDPQTLNVEEYELTRNFWDRYLQTGPRIPAATTLSCSKDLLVVPEKTQLAFGSEWAAEGGYAQAADTFPTPSQGALAPGRAVESVGEERHLQEDRPTLPGQKLPGTGNRHFTARPPQVHAEGEEAQPTERMPRSD
jgi:uncharacterized protein YrrD